MGEFKLDRPLAQYIDHTLLKPEAASADIEKLCREAAEHGFYSVCVNTSWVPLCRERLADTGVKVCAVVGFPLGAMLTEAKAAETRLAVAAGAEEIDMVLSVGRLLEGRFDEVESDIRAVVEAAGAARVKVILETGLLPDDAAKRKACELSERAGAAFVKTSTGFGPGRATVEDVSLMRASVSAAVEVKASGGVRDAEAALLMIEAGATRIGTSSGIAIVQGRAGTGAY